MKLHSAFKEIKKINGIIIAIAVLLIIISVFSDKFLQFSNIMNVLRQTSTIGIMACGTAFVMIGGSIDLSIGSILSLCALISCKMTSYNTIFAILMPLIVGISCGAFNGFLVGKLKFNPFITTLGTLSVYQALAFFYSDGRFLNAAQNNSYKQIGQGYLFKIPIPIIICVFVVLIFLYLFKKTIFGRKVLAVGGNSVSAEFSGISYSKITILTYMLSGLCAAISSIIFVSRIMSAQPEMGSGYEFDVITAVIIGGVSLSGGKGTIWGAVLGVLFIGILKNSFILFGIPLFVQFVAMGIILILAVAIDSLKEIRRNEF